MVKIGLMSDTHSYLDDDMLRYFADCDEIWHAGDVGDVRVLNRLEAFKPVRGVYGNIDDSQIRNRLPLDNYFEVSGLSVFITHIGGYPGKYNARVKAMLKKHQPQLYICGHSHILKIMPDPKKKLLHINPGACGQHGFHQVRTMVRFAIEDARVTHLEVIELGKRGLLDN